MRVVTPAIKLDVRIDEVQARAGQLVMSGIAGMLPCETILRAGELRRLLRMLLRPAVLGLLFARDPVQAAERERK